MRILGKFFTDELAIDLGTVNTLVYMHERGIVLNEPSAVAVHKYTGEILHVGAEALKMLGREPHDTEVHRPIRGGTIDNFELAQKMLTAFINQAHNGVPRRSRVIIGVPGSSTTLEQRSVRDAARDARATHVDLIDEGLAAAFGAGLDFDDENAHLIVDIGGGTTNVTITSSGAVVSSSSFQAAGNEMDAAIRDYMRTRFEVLIGERTSEEIKIALGTALPAAAQNGPSRSLEVVGKQLTDGLARVVRVTSEDISRAIEPVVTEIVAGVRRAIEESQPDVTADIYHSGLILSGGGALLGGMAERLQEEIRLHVALADEPLQAVVLGAGRLLEDPVKLQRSVIREDAPAWQSSEELVINW